MRDVLPTRTGAAGAPGGRATPPAPERAGTVLTIGEVLAERERRQFVGRERELGEFISWLTGTADAPRILSVVGPGGIGKTTLVQAFARRAEAVGRAVTLVDGRVTAATPAGLAAALGASSTGAAVEALNSGCALLVLDSFEDLRPLTHFLLEDFLPSLTSDVAVVIASREDVTAAWRPWREFVRVITVGGLRPAEARELLLKRGLSEPGDIDRIMAATGGYPLALAMAADVALRTGAPLLPSLPEWRMAVRSLVEDMLRYDDPGLRPLLEAAAILRQFDEPTLAEMSPGDDVSRAFARLCSLSVVRPGPRGLMLHDEVRRTLREDLRWRNPQRYDALRLRAVEHYRRRLAEVGTEEAGWVLTEVTYLSEDPFVHLTMFGNDDPSELWAEPVRPADRERILAMQASLASRLPNGRERPTPEELDPHLMETLLAVPEARIRIAWSHTHGAVGYGLALPIIPAVLDVLPPDGAIRRLARAALGTSEGGARPGCAGQGAAPRCGAGPGNAWFLGTIVSVPEHPDLALGVLTREITRLFGERPLLMACSADPVYLSALGSFGFSAVPFQPPAGAFPGLTGKVLDLRLLGSEGYLEAIAKGESVPRVPPADDLESAVEAALEHWAEDRWLAGSPLADLARALLKAPDESPAESVRRLISIAMATAHAQSPAETDNLRAIELAYLQGTPKLEVAARHLGVSRPTFYRMRKRGMHALTQAVMGTRGGASPP